MTLPKQLMVSRNTVNAFARPAFRPWANDLPGSIPPKRTTIMNATMIAPNTGVILIFWPMTRKSDSRYMEMIAIIQPMSATNDRFFSWTFFLILRRAPREIWITPRVKENFMMVFCCWVAVTPKSSG